MNLKELFGELPDRSLFLEDFALSAQGSPPDFDPRYAKVIGTSDGRDVWGSRCFGPDVDIYAFRTGEELDAFVAVETKVDDTQHHRLLRVWCAPGKTGQGFVSALLGFITKKAHLQLRVAADEGITKDGIEWLVKLIKSPHGFKITSQDGEVPSSEKLKREWQTAKGKVVSGSTELFIENFRNHRPFFKGGYRSLSESAQHLGSTELD